jgi:uncharacterized protein (DUF1810 family)
MELYNLQRFLDAQETSYKTALKEIQDGAKKSHWMWYIFPQCKGLGYSEISKKYAIKTKEEAIAYVKHPVLGKKLIEISSILLNHSNKTANEIFGWPDDTKLKSSMTLFTLIQKENDIFQQVLNKYFDGKICWKTKKMINA